MRRYITLNRASEWRRGLLSGLTIGENNVIPDLSSEEWQSGRCTLVTGSIDSTERDFVWRDLLIDADSEENALPHVSAFSANSETAEIDGKPVSLDRLLRDERLSAAERLSLTSRLFRPLFTACRDGLINLTGRYLWLKLEWIVPERRAFSLNKIKILLDGESMADYLPELYRRADDPNGFFLRFIRIFDSLFFEMDAKTERFRQELDYRAAQGELLQYLARWIGIEDAAYLPDERLREIICEAPKEFGKNGVKRVLEKQIERECGVFPNIVEYFRVRKMTEEGKNRSIYRRLFGDDPYRFFILLPEDTFRGTHGARAFTEKLKRIVPAHTEAEVVLLRKNTVLDAHTYLGVNSVLAGCTPAVSDRSGISEDFVLGG